MTTGSLRVPATGALADLLACPPPLLDVTLDQLRTLLAVREAGSPLAAARILGREHSSVRKQVDTLNHAFQQICGEALVVKQGPRAGLPVHADRRGHDPDRGRHVHQLVDRDHRAAPPSRRDGHRRHH